MQTGISFFKSFLLLFLRNFNKHSRLKKFKFTGNYLSWMCSQERCSKVFGFILFLTEPSDYGKYDLWQNWDSLDQTR